MEFDFLFKLFWKKLSNTIEEACGGNVNQLRSYKNLPSSCRAEINPQPRKSHAGQKLVIANQWVSSCNGCKSHLTKAEPAGQ